MAFSPITSWQIDGKTVETVRYFILGAPKSLQMVLADMKLRHLLLERKFMTNLESILKSRDTAFQTRVHLVKAIVFPGAIMDVRVGTIKEAEC